MLVFLLPNCQIINKFTGIIMFSIETDYYRKMQKALIINDNEKKISASALTLFQSNYCFSPFSLYG